MKLVSILLLAICTLQDVNSHDFTQFKTITHPVPIDAAEPYILTPLIENSQIEEARAKALVNYPDFNAIVSYSGYLQVDKELDNNLFFYFYPSEDDYPNDPVILWLQGEPGAPAGKGIFIENGAFVINKDNSVNLREYRWNRNHSVLYIDSPVGTGFSFTKNEGYAKDQTKVGQDLYEALLQFFQLFPELRKNDFFIVGESYGGKYAPAIGHTIHTNNPSASIKINLKGLATGNGLSDPVNQANYGDYLYQLGLVDAKTKDTLHTYEDLVKDYVHDEKWAMATDVFNSKMMSAILEATSLVSVANYLQLDPDEPQNWRTYIIQENVRDAMHIGNTDFGVAPVFDNLVNDIAQSVAPWISDLLSNYRFLMYSGQNDVTAPYPTTVNFLQNLDFSSAEEYKVAKRQVWEDSVGTAGYYKEAGNLTELLLRNAGHSVPVDQPKRAYMMIYSFIRGLPFPFNL